jgi:hypothetical protein
MVCSPQFADELHCFVPGTNQRVLGYSVKRDPSYTAMSSVSSALLPPQSYLAVVVLGMPKGASEFWQQCPGHSEISDTFPWNTVFIHPYNVSYYKIVHLLWYDPMFDIGIVTYSGFSIHDGTLLHSKSRYTTVKHSQKLLEHTYTSDPHGLGTLTTIEFFQQGLLWQSSNTRSHSCNQKASKHTSGQSIVGLSVHLHTTTSPRRIVHH